MSRPNIRLNLHSLSKSVEEISPKSGDWPHYGVDVPFFSGEVGPMHRWPKAYMSRQW